MNIFRLSGERIDKYTITTVDKDRVYKDKKRFGRWYSQELKSLVDRLLDGDYVVAAKILNLPPQKVGLFRIKTEEWIRTEFLNDSICIYDYYRAVRFFDDIKLPNIPSEDVNTVKLYNGYYYEAEDTRLVKYGVKFDRMRLKYILVHIRSICGSRDDSRLIGLLDNLLKGDFSLVPEIFAIARKEQRCDCSCPTQECSQYFSGLLSAIEVEEYVSLSNAEFEEMTKTLDIDCPEEHAPIKPRKREDIGDPFAADSQGQVITGEGLVDARLSFLRGELDKAVASRDDVMISYWQNLIKSEEAAYDSGTTQTQDGKQMSL